MLKTCFLTNLNICIHKCIFFVCWTLNVFNSKCTAWESGGSTIVIVDFMNELIVCYSINKLDGAGAVLKVILTCKASNVRSIYLHDLVMFKMTEDCCRWCNSYPGTQDPLCPPIFVNWLWYTSITTWGKIPGTGLVVFHVCCRSSRKVSLMWMHFSNMLSIDICK